MTERARENRHREDFEDPNERPPEADAEAEQKERLEERELAPETPVAAVEKADEPPLAEGEMG